LQSMASSRSNRQREIAFPSSLQSHNHHWLINQVRFQFSSTA
jgi:hypothetical protein